MSLQRCPNTTASKSSSDTGLGAADSISPQLLDRLLCVLEDEEATMMPATAGETMTQSEWDSLTADEREPFRQAQLQRVDPRLIARTILRASETGEH